MELTMAPVAHQHWNSLFTEQELFSRRSPSSGNAVPVNLYYDCLVLSIGSEVYLSCYSCRKSVVHKATIGFRRLFVGFIALKAENSRGRTRLHVSLVGYMHIPKHLWRYESDAIPSTSMGKLSSRPLSLSRSALTGMKINAFHAKHRNIQRSISFQISKIVLGLMESYAMLSSRLLSLSKFAPVGSINTPQCVDYAAHLPIIDQRVNLLSV